MVTKLSYPDVQYLAEAEFLTAAPSVVTDEDCRYHRHT
jgi:hypothetical protein